MRSNRARGVCVVLSPAEMEHLLELLGKLQGEVRSCIDQTEVLLVRTETLGQLLRRIASLEERVASLEDESRMPLPVLPVPLEQN